MNCGVYKIENKANGKRYIGSSVDLHRRFIQHKSDLCNNRHCNKHLQNSWNKYGKECFEFVVLLYCDEDCVHYYEQVLLDNMHNEYNMAISAMAPMLGKTHTKEARAKISNAGRGSRNVWYKTGPPRWVVEKAIRANTGNKYNEGRVWTKEQRNRLSEAHTGKALSERHKAKIGWNSRGINNPNSKLTASDVIKMRKIRKDIGMTYKKIGEMFGVSWGTAYDVIKRNSWKHVHSEDDVAQLELF